MMSDDDRLLFELRNELSQAVEVEGRAGLQKHLTLVQWLISKRARGECPHIHAEDWPEIRSLLQIGHQGPNFGPRIWGPGWPPRSECDWGR